MFIFNNSRALVGLTYTYLFNDAVSISDYINAYC